MAIDVDQPVVVPPPAPRRAHWGWWLTAGAMVLVLVVGGTALHSWLHNRAPFSSAAVHPQLVGLQVMTPTDARGSNVVAALDRLGDRPHAADIPYPRGHRHWQYVVGRVDIGAHSAPHGTSLELIVIDNRTNQLPPLIFPQPENGASAHWTASGFDSGVTTLGTKYPWLGAVREREINGSFQDPGDVISIVPGPARSLPFVAVLPSDALPVTNRHTDITVALGLVGPDGQAYWATKLN